VKHKWIFWHSLSCASMHKHTHPGPYSAYSPRAPWQISVRVAPPTINWGLFDSSCKHYASKYTSAKVWYSPCQPNNTLYTWLHINHMQFLSLICDMQTSLYIQYTGYYQFACENIVWVLTWDTQAETNITLLDDSMKKLYYLLLVWRTLTI